MQAFYDSPICALPTPPACENFVLVLTLALVVPHQPYVTPR